MVPKKEKRIQDIYPLSPMQESMLFHSLLDQESSAYFEQSAFSINGEVDISILEKSFQMLIDRYDIFRTVFRVDKVKEPLQFVLKHRKFKIHFEDISHLEAEERESWVQEFKVRDRKRGFDLTKDVLIRISLLQLSSRLNVLVWSFHHILMDGWCIAIIFKELIRIYRSLLQGKGKPVGLEPVIPYKNYIKWLKKQDKQKGLLYWTEYLDGCETQTSVPKIRNHARNKDNDEYQYTLEEFGFFVDPLETERLVEIARENQVTINTIFQTLWGILVQRYNYTEDVVYGVVVSGRPPGINGVETMVGLFINTVPVRIENRDVKTFSQLIQKVQQKVVKLKSFEFLPLAEIQGCSPLKMNLITHAMGFENYPIQREVENISGEYGHGHENDHEPGIGFVLGKVDVYEQSNYDFNIVIVSGKRILVKFNYNSSEYEKNYVERISRQFQGVIEQVIDHSNIDLSDIKIIRKEEKKQVLYEFNRTETDYPREETIHELFEEQVAQNPDRVAVVFEDSQITYNALDKKANRLAWRLRSRGVTAGHIVGLMTTPSLETMVGILGILKSGGAYLSLDPDYPRKRMDSILEDSQISILLAMSDALKMHSFTALQGIHKIKTPPKVTIGRPQIKDLDRFSIPDRSLVNYEKYSKYIGIAMFKHSFSLQATRGCPYSCAYCHKIWPKKHVVRSAENIFSEVKQYYDIGIRRFSLVDDIFNLDKKNSTRFYELIIKNGLDLQLYFPNGVRGDLLTKADIDLMMRAGTTSIALALETASPRLQTLIGKNLNLDILRENLRYICEKYPHVILELFTMLGFPTESEEEAVMTLEFIKSLRWVDFPSVNILKIYPGTDMEKLALENGISREAIIQSLNLGYHELPGTLPFDKNFTLWYQNDYLNNYFLSRDRLLDVLIHQMTLLTEDEIVQKYNSYLPVEINSLDDLLQLGGITKDELAIKECADGSYGFVPGLNEKLSAHFPANEPEKNALKVLLLDLSQFFGGETDILYDVVEAPLGLMYLMTYLKHQYGAKINGKIAKSRIDFNNYIELNRLLREFKADVIGVRTLTFYREFFHKTIAMIRQWGIDVPIIAGGPYASSDYSRILMDKNVDCVVRGEGEITFSHLIGKIMENSGKLPSDEELKNIPGIAFVPGEENSRDKSNREIIMIDGLSLTETEQFSLSDEPGKPLENINRASDLAYAIFTSGSSGRPKGVLVEHRNVVRLVQNTNYVEFKRDDRILQTGALEFDASTFELWGALLNGLQLYFTTKDKILSAETLKELIRKWNIRTIWMTSPLFNHMIQIDEELFAGLRNLLVGGDVLNPVNINKIQKRFPELKIINGYGPTENTTFSTTLLIDDHYRDSIPIGGPISNSTAYVVDIHINLLPVGAMGELCTGGDGVARGYLNDLELTHEKFIANPLLKGDRLYRTGDIAKWLPDGTMEFLGRIDNQVKMRGFRIEPGEIETHLLTHEAVKEAVVVLYEKERENLGNPVKEEDENKYLCAYVVLDETALRLEEDVDLSGLKNYISYQLPEYMIPLYIIPLERIPLTPNGKVDRSALPAPEAGRKSDIYVAPADESEASLIEIWSEILGIEKGIIGVDSDFFDLGGHSLKVTLMVAKIHKQFSIRVPVSEIFNSPTVRGLAQYVRGAKKEKYVSIGKVEKKTVYVQSSAQRRLFTLHHMNPGSSNYNVPQIFRLEGVYHNQKLEGIFREMIKRHESFRTSFDMVGELPVQVVHDYVSFNVEYYDQEDEKKNTRSEERIVKDFIRSFDLIGAPLLRVGIIKQTEGNSILMVDMHHIISDGTSIGIFIKEIMALYHGKQLPELRIQYKDFAEWEQRLVKSGEMEKQQVYWLRVFEEPAPVLNLPIDYLRPSIQSFEGTSLSFSLSTGETETLKRIAGEENASLYMILLAIFNIFLSKLSGQEDIIVGTPIAGRRHSDLENVIGMFVNTLAMRNYPNAEKTFIEFLKSVRERTLEAFENQDYQFEDLVEKVVLTRDTSRNPLFDVLFALQNVEISTVEIPGLKIKPYRQESKTSKFDLSLFAVEAGSQLVFAFEYNTKLFKKETIERLMEDFLQIISVLIEDKYVKIETIELASKVSIRETTQTSSFDVEFNF
jgi:amino acid adenylation domain-containing protein